MEKEKYETLLSELAEVIKSKNTTIILQRYEIEELKKKLEAAEKEAAAYADNCGKGV